MAPLLRLIECAPHAVPLGHSVVNISRLQKFPQCAIGRALAVVDLGTLLLAECSTRPVRSAAPGPVDRCCEPVQHAILSAGPGQPATRSHRFDWTFREHHGRVPEYGCASHLFRRTVCGRTSPRQCTIGPANPRSSVMPERPVADQRCRWEMLVQHQWQRCSKPRRHDGAHQLGGVTIGRRAIVRLRLQRDPNVRRTKTRLPQQ